MTLTDVQVTEVIATIQQYATAYRKKDIRALSALFAPGISGFGSGPDEVISNHDDFIQHIRRDMSQATLLSIEYPDQQVFGDGRVAWVTSGNTMTYTVDGKTKETLRGRVTMVLRNTGSRWVIEQLHFSMPYGEQSTGQSFPGA